jgi:hypothetical protein
VTFHDRQAAHWCNEVNGSEMTAPDGKVHAVWCPVQGSDAISRTLELSEETLDRAEKAEAEVERLRKELGRGDAVVEITADTLKFNAAMKEAGHQTRHLGSALTISKLEAERDRYKAVVDAAREAEYLMETFDDESSALAQRLRDALRAQQEES